MRKIIYSVIVLSFLTVSISSCRDENKEEKTEQEELIQEMQENGAETKIKEDDGDVKIKMETDDKEVKIKKDSDGDVKIKVDED